MSCLRSRLDVRKLMCVILFFFPVELHLLPLHLSSIRKLLCRTICLVSPFYIELRMRSFYIFGAKTTIPCAGKLRPVKTLLFLPCQEPCEAAGAGASSAPFPQEHHCGHSPSSQLPARAAHSKFALTKIALRDCPTGVIEKEREWLPTWGQKSVL